MKNLTPVLIAFFLGMVLCFTIQACGEDKSDVVPSGNEDDTAIVSDIYGWDAEKFSSRTTYPGDGSWDKVTYEYDKSGRVVREAYTCSDPAVQTYTKTYVYEGNQRTIIDSRGGKTVEVLYRPAEK